MHETSSNPFNITFGEEPASLIDRKEEFLKIVSTFESDSPESKITIITGPRGCGKTVLLSQVKHHFDERADWITADLTQYSNMLEQLAAKLYENGKLKHLFLKGEFNFSFRGLSFSIRGESPVSNVETLLERMLGYLKSKGKCVLVTIDDVASGDYLRQFIQSYQSFLREKYPLFLLMTGLHENISNLQTTRNLTFLLRAPKLVLPRLSLRAIALAYRSALGIDDKRSIDLAKLTNGYAYAYQLVGNALYKSKSDKLSKAELDAIDLSLEENAYSIIWKNMSGEDKKMAYAMLDHAKASDIMQKLGITNSKYQVYRKRLINIGIADDSARGSLSFSLPRFKEFVRFQKEIEDE